MANKIKCTCGHSWSTADSSAKDKYVCHICGKNNMKDGGWLNKYEKAENGIEGTMGGLTDKGFNYNGAWGGPSMQVGGNLWKTDKKAYVDSTLNANKNLEWVKRLYESNPKAVMVPGETSPSTHLIGDNDQGYVFPRIVNMNGQLVDLGDGAEDYARKTNTGIQFPKEQGTWFARSTGEDSGYKMGTGVLKGKPVMQKYKSIDKKAMGGSMPGAVGFTYARTGSIPSNGPYAKKTMASAQDGKELEYKELPEITVVGSKDKQTRDFYNNLIDKFSEGEPASAENPFIDARVMGQYLGVMNMGKEYGFPKVKPETKSGIYRTAKGHYNPLTKTIYANDVPTWVSEMAHHVQMKDNIVGKGLQWLGNDLIEYIKQPIASIKGEKLSSPYTTEGTVEHEAHSIIQPMLEERAMKDYEKYRDSELAKSREKRFLLENRNLQNGGEMKFYQEGLDWKPRNISRDGSVIKNDRGQWAHPGEITEIGSPYITMKGVPYPVLGVSDEGDTKMMYPGEDYKFKGNKVTEYPMAQDGWVQRAANANLSFWEKCRLASSADNGVGGRMVGGSDRSPKYKNAYEEISDIKAYEKDERKAFEKSRPQDVDIADWVAVNRDASRMNALLRNPDYEKYTDEQGVLKPEYQSVATRFDPYYLYYKPAFSGKKEVSPIDILEYQKSQPGGLAGYKELVNRRYMPEKKKQGGWLEKYK